MASACSKMRLRPADLGNTTLSFVPSSASAPAKLEHACSSGFSWHLMSLPALAETYTTKHRVTTEYGATTRPHHQAGKYLQCVHATSKNANAAVRVESAANTVTPCQHSTCTHLLCSYSPRGTHNCCPSSKRTPPNM